MKLPYKVMSSAALSVVVASIPVIVHAQAGDFYNQTKQLKYSQSDLRSNATLANKLQDEMDNGDTIIKEVTTGQYLDYVKANDAFVNVIGNGGDVNTALTEAITAGATSATSDELNGYTPATPDDETLAVSSVSAITATDVTVVLKDATTAVPSVDKFDIVANGNKVVATKVEAVDTTAKTYKLTIPELKDQGELTVNGSTAKKYDFKAPVFKSVEAVDSTHIMVTFDEDVAVVTPVSPKTLNDYFNIKSIAGTNPSVVSAVVQADKSKVLLTLDGANALVSGTGNYVLNLAKESVNDVYTDAANKNDAYQVAFNGTSKADETGATLTSATYEKATKKVTIKFNKETASTLDSKKVSINDVVLTDSDAAVQSADKVSFVITLSDATKAKVDALTGDLTVKVAAEAVKDAYNDKISNAETTSALKVSVAPEFVDASSSYDETTHVATLKFTSPVKVSDIGKIQLGSATLTKYNATTNVNGDKVAETDYADTIHITLGTTNQDAVQSVVEGQKLAVKVLKDAVIDANDVKNSVDYDKTIAYAQDTKAPSLVSATYANLDATLKLTFDENIRDIANNALDNSKSKLYFKIGDADPVEIAGATTAHSIDKDGKTLVLTLDSTSKTPLETAYSANQPIKVFLAKDSVADRAGTSASDANKNEAMTKDTAIAVNFADTSVPALAITPDHTAGPTAYASVKGIELASNTQIHISFTTRMDKATAENVANYALTDLYGASVSIKSVSLSSTTSKDVYITTTDKMTQNAAGSSFAYSLKITGLKSVANIPAGTIDTIKFNVASANDADTTGPVIDAANSKFQPVSGVDNDTIVVAYTEPAGVDKATAEDPANYVLIKGTTKTQLTADNAKLVYANNKVTITLKGINLENVTTAGAYKIQVTNVKDVLGNVIATTDPDDATATPNVKALTLDATGSYDNTAPQISGAMVETNATSADKVTVLFNEEVDATTAGDKANYGVVINGAVKTPVSVSVDAKLKQATLTLAEGDKVPAGTASLLIKYKGIKDLAGNSVGTDFVTKTATVSDLTPPAFETTNPVVATATNGDDTVVLDFNEAVQTTNTDERNFVVTINGVAVPVKADVTTADADTPYVVTADGSDKIRITFKSGLVDFVKGDTITVTAKNVKDIAGNVLTSATASTVAVTSTAAPTAVAAAFTDNRNVALTFTAAADIMKSSVSKDDFTIDGAIINDVNVSGKVVTLTLAAPAVGVVTVKPSTTFAVKDVVGNDVPATLFGANGLDTSGAPTDTIPPVNEVGYPKIDTVKSTGFTIKAETNETGTAYYVVVPKDATAPTVAEVKAGTNYGTVTVAKAGNISLTASTEASKDVTGLTANTDYDVYVVSQDAAPNLQASPVKLQVTTAASSITGVGSLAGGQDAVKASNTITVTTLPTAGDTLTVGDATFEFQDTATAVQAGNIKIDITTNDTAAKVAAAIVAANLSGKNVTAAAVTGQPTQVKFVAATAGTAGNALASSESAANVTGEGTFTGGAAAVKGSKTITVASVPAKGATLTVGDATFEFQDTATAAQAGNIKIDITTNDTAAKVAAAIVAANLSGKNVTAAAVAGQDTQVKFEAATAGIAGNVAMSLTE